MRWYAIPDDEVKVAHGFSPAELARLGAPLSLMGIKALFKMCCDGLIINALQQASLFQNEFSEPALPEVDGAVQCRTTQRRDTREQSNLSAQASDLQTGRSPYTRECPCDGNCPAESLIIGTPLSPANFSPN